MSLTPGGSITRCLARLREGDRGAAERLWGAYVRRLVCLARARLRAAPRRAADEEDVALSAFDSFCRRAERGQFARLDDRDDLWQVLVMLTERKAVDLIRHEGRQARDAGRVRSLSDPDAVDAAWVRDPGPTPEFAAEVADECRRLLALLGDGSLRQVALDKLEGRTNAEIAARLGCIEQTVERKLRSIRRLWSGEDRP
jgi:DNA-directed RNA polymerase specialized sigma24 family protein